MPIDLDALANTMFGRTTPTGPSAPPAGIEHTDMEQRMFPQQAEADRQRLLQGQQRPPTDQRPFDSLTDEEKSARLFGATEPILTYADSAQAIRNAAMENHLADPAAAATVAAEWAETFAAHSLSGTEAKQLADLGAQVMREPPTAELVATWTEAAVADLKATYGVQGAGQALEDARSYIGMRDGLGDLLDSLGIGSHPAIVRAAAERGRQLRLQGRLK